MDAAEAISVIAEEGFCVLPDLLESQEAEDWMLWLDR